MIDLATKHNYLFTGTEGTLQELFKELLYHTSHIPYPKIFGQFYWFLKLSIAQTATLEV